jgi:hypothetical protein
LRIGKAMETEMLPITTLFESMMVETAAEKLV